MIPPEQIEEKLAAENEESETMAGLSSEQVLTPAYNTTEKNVSPQLKKWQVDCMNAHNLRAEQVTEPWFTLQHAFVLETENISYESIQDLNVTQIRGLLANLTLEQVTVPWFQSAHLGAIEDGIPYESIRELSMKAVQQLQLLKSETAIRKHRTALFSYCSPSTSFKCTDEERKMPPPKIIFSSSKSAAQQAQEALDAEMAVRLQAEDEHNVYFPVPSDNDMPH
jgi:hypothetical protein